jgi:hypothetical protein
MIRLKLEAGITPVSIPKFGDVLYIHIYLTAIGFYPGGSDTIRIQQTTNRIQQTTNRIHTTDYK